MSNTDAQAVLLNYFIQTPAVRYGGGSPQVIHCPHCRYIAFTAEQIDRHCRQDHNDENKINGGF